MRKSLDNPKQVQYDQDNRNDKQSVNPIASAWETRTYIPAEIAEQPKYYQNHDDNPQHKISPFE
jgi:hypothetical protein